MSLLQKALESGEFAVTAELAPPKGTDFSHALQNAELFGDRVHAINVTDFQSSSLKATSLAMCKALIDLGLEPVFQITGRDRNRIAIQGEMLSAGFFGVKNLLALTGDHTTVGDNPGAKPVYDLDSIGILQAATMLASGVDMGGNKLEGSPSFFLGASVTPEYDPIELQLIKMKKKIIAGAKFFQTQAVYDIRTMEKFKEITKHLNTKILVGIIPLKSAGMARFMNKKIPGINVPDELIDRLKLSKDPVQEGIKIAGEFIVELKNRNLCDGVHIMAIGAEENVPLILDAAEL
ncbi:Methylenetetrahydrofolate reductase [Tepidanaerobacter acetatoxydans Re1]|uniref:Methylenetetrahydrofolate reductase n=2 Tax=Tepidanaerobacter acetatoxydans (strain DSM 21804 / JCM 16047 / Re1) TaxID=1209989 RepID=F4LTH9_TEPAE|nr:methylenetetrahydrofolate reductase [Tepidanaerobacter acetatoxydans]AEE90510.1 methylenetetrahydrofolate reductase [Tepidanaerobacter acetatoxydans Re1]CCP25019.1 Methylenetetrahydrofolate reductase [Tepidanaerobacter acetatoxydans Re1]